MPDKELSILEARPFESVSDASQREKAEEDFESLVETIHQWFSTCYFVHGQFPEVGGTNPLRGYMRWMWRGRLIAASTRPCGKQWPSASTPHQPGTCWCGVLSRAEEARLAAEGTISAHDAVSRLSCDDDPDEKI